MVAALGAAVGAAAGVVLGGVITGAVCAGGLPFRLRVIALLDCEAGAVCVAAGARVVRDDVVCATAGTAKTAALEASKRVTRRVRTVFMSRNIVSRRPDGKTRSAPDPQA